jgi:hypothetical protein
MSAACAFAIVPIAASGPVSPGYVYEATAASANVTLTLPAQASANGVPLVVKRIDSTGFTVSVVAAAGEKVNGTTSSDLTQQGQGQWFWPGAPQGPAAGTGWVSY